MIKIYQFNCFSSNENQKYNFQCPKEYLITYEEMYSSSYGWGCIRNLASGYWKRTRKSFKKRSGVPFFKPYLKNIFAGCRIDHLVDLGEHTWSDNCNRLLSEEEEQRATSIRTSSTTTTDCANYATASCNQYKQLCFRCTTTSGKAIEWKWLKPIMRI